MATIASASVFPEVHMEWVYKGSAQFWLGGAEKAVLEEQMLGLFL